MPETSSMNQASGLRQTSLSRFQISGISSMVRELDWLADDIPRLEAAILEGRSLESVLAKSLEVRAGSSLTARVGDVVFFRMMDKGPYPDMETLWGGRVGLVPGGVYVGVVCERCSTKFFTAKFGNILPSYDGLVLQYIAQAGGIGHCTGYSPPLKEQTGYGHPSNVEVLGVLYHRTRSSYLNTISMSGALSEETISSPDAPPTVLIVGTATDVGKTTLACKLLRELSTNLRCAAIKASGTAWYKDSQAHANSGAALALNFSFAGLPTTYYIDSHLYKRSIYRLYRYVSNIESLPAWKRPPETRDCETPAAEVLVIEHGGDILGANVPTFLQDECLLGAVKVIVVCCESALALMGALKVLQEKRVDSSRLLLYGAMPLMNPQAFLERAWTLVDSGLMHGVVDVNKPDAVPEKGWEREYTSDHSRITSVKNLAAVITTIIRGEDGGSPASVAGLGRINEER